MAPVIYTSIPGRLDRLPWSVFHLKLVLALGITWVLDGLEVTLVGTMGAVLQRPDTLGLSGEEIGAAASAYVTGAVVGALFFGYLTDRLGRKRMFFLTLAIYLTGVLWSAFAWNGWSFALFRLLTGLGIGGEYAAINSAIDEWMPARLRGRVDLIVNGSFWIGAALGAGVTLVLFDWALIPAGLGWRFGFAFGAALGLVILGMRRYVPESPRWMIIHGKAGEAERLVAEIERQVERKTGRALPLVTTDLALDCHPALGFRPILGAVTGQYRRRGFLGLMLMTAQAFFYNSVFFTYSLVLVRFYGVEAEKAGLCVFPLALGNWMGPLLLGYFFDAVGRRRMIAGTFTAAGLLLGANSWAFACGLLSAREQILLWTVVFFLASAAASSAYLTVSEIFPLEIRALAIAFFYAVGTGLGGSVAPWLFGRLIEAGARSDLSLGYLIAAVLMLVAGVTEWIFGVDAENQGLETVAQPLSAAKQS
ncbi:MFS transporter [Candidatus Methylacidithermus pantelleriae]|uniref:MFS transporter n=1 Tax=Candidatus Methylacidithermus pantelleriae TaxID=2744239 RepID=UPI001BD514D1|nr:MFS transporter [Candidatus Methylacidithermus pantelleriae]